MYSHTLINSPKPFTHQHFSYEGKYEGYFLPSYLEAYKLFSGLPTATAKTSHNFCSATAKTLHNSCSDTAAILHTFCSVTAKQLQCHCKGVAAALQKECSDSAKGMQWFAVPLSVKQGTTYRDTPILISNHLFSFDISEAPLSMLVPFHQSFGRANPRNAPRDSSRGYVPVRAVARSLSDVWEEVPDNRKG